MSGPISAHGNVGNTTIVTDAALIHEHTLDQSLY